MDKIQKATLKRLARLGWPKAVELLGNFCPKSYAKLVKQYQRFHGLKADGVVGTVTQRNMEMPRVCGLPERMNVNARTCKWPMLDVSWHIVSGVPAMSIASRKDCFAEACRRWNAICGIRLAYNPNAKTANIQIRGVRLDGPNGVLADMMLPCGARESSVMNGRTDTSERWKAYDGSGVAGELDLIRTDCHELGHGIGIPHISNGNLLQPMWDRHIWAPQGGDIAEAQARYGKSKVEAEPPKPAPTPTGPDRIQVVKLELTYMGQDPSALRVNGKQVSL